MNKYIHADDMPPRKLHLTYLLDTNKINAKLESVNVNKLESWRENGVICLLMPLTAYNEACTGNGPNYEQRKDKAEDYFWIETNDTLGGEDEFRNCIESILFPSGTIKQNDKNDVIILLDAKRSLLTLVTGDHHILRHAARLSSECGIVALSAKQAVTEVKKYIRRRDAIATNIARTMGCSVPEWVGKD